MIDEAIKIENQASFISSKLSIHEPCELKTKYIDSLDKVSIDTLKHILSHNFSKGADMKAVLCLFDTLFLSLLNKKEVKKQNGIYILTEEELKKYITKIEVLTSGADATVYNATFFSNVDLVIKLGNNEDEAQDEEEKIAKIKQEMEMIIREYYIGVKSINKLRYIVPNFVYTLGSFMSDKLGDSSMPFIVYEKIPGKTVYDLIVKDLLTFDKWLIIFFQLLLALEVAQREVDFTHFDLHDKNVIIREQKDFNYSVLLDMSTYTINDPTFIPVIIDFGRSNCTVDGQTIGTYGREHLGVLNHMIQGQDMYMFMSHCCNEVKDINLKLQIASLFSEFYGKDNPYPIKIVENKSGQKVIWGAKLKSVSSNFEMVPFTPVGHYTPLMFIQWLLENEKYSPLLKQYVTVTEREMSQSLQYSIMVKKYNEIFNYVKKGVDKATSLLLSLNKRNSSYVITKYSCVLLQRYNINLQSVSLLQKIEEVNKFLDENKEEMINFDKDMLKKVFTIKIPSQEDLDTCVNNILQLEIYLPFDVRINTLRKGYTFNLEPIKDATEKLNSVLRYEDELKSYLKFYFTILELHLDVEFNEWVKQFKNSEIYSFYRQNYLQTERARRWSTTLLMSSKNNEKATSIKD
jgi:serine/threonine protein kinase